MEILLQWLFSFLIEGAYVLIPVLFVLGIPLKMSARIPDWIIIYILVALGILGGLLLLGPSVGAAFQGILCAAAACLTYQLIKQGKEAVLKRKSKDPE